MTMNYLDIFNSKINKFGFVKIHHNNAFDYSDKKFAWIGEYIPLDDTNGIELCFNLDIEDIYDKTHERNELFKNNEEIDASQIMYFYYNDVNLKQVQDKLPNDKPLCIISTIQFSKQSYTDAQRLKDFLYSSLNKTNPSKEKDKLFDFYILNSLDSYDFILIIHSNEIGKIIKILADIVHSNQGSICFSFVGYRDGIKWDETLEFAYIHSISKNFNTLYNNSNGSYVVLGIDDLCLPFNNIKSIEFVNKLKDFYSNRNYYRLGVVLGKHIEISDDLTDSKEFRSEFFTKTRRKNLIQNANLPSQFLEQLTKAEERTLASFKNMLVLLETSNLYSPLCDMLVQSFVGFCKIIKNNINQINFDNQIRSDDILSYLNEAYNLISNTLYGYSYNFHTSSSFTTRDIPARLLQSYYKLVTNVSQILRNENDPFRIKYYYLLIPGYYGTLTVRNIFAYFPPMERLLIMRLPNEMIFKPKILFPTLIHEIAHYSGDKCRHRQLRFDILIKLTAYLIICEIKMEGTKYVHLVRYLFNLLYNDCKSVAEESRFDHSYFMVDVQNFLNAYLMNLELFSFSLKNQMIDIISNWNEDAEHMVTDYLLDKNRLVVISATLNSIYDIISETYADIISISVLKISDLDYLAVLYGNKITEITSDLFYFRLNILSKIFKWNFDGLSKTNDSIYKLVKSYNNYRIKNKMLMASVEFLFPYFEKVVETIKMRQEDFKDIREAYESLS